MIFDELATYTVNDTPWVTDHDPIALARSGDFVRPYDVADAAARIAASLLARGISANDRLVVWLASPIDVIVAYAAITAIDAVPVLISHRLSAETVAAMVADVADVVGFVAEGERLDQLQSVLPGQPRYDWRELAADAAERPRFARRKAVPGDGAYVVVHTSGTTNVPKLVECSARSIDFNAQVQAVIHRASRLEGYCGLQLSPVHGRTVVGILAALKRRAPLMLLQEESAENVEPFLRRHRPSYLETHPNTFRAWQHLAKTGAFESVTFFGTGFDTIHPDTVQDLLDGSRRLVPMFGELYGQNESGPIAFRCHFRPLHRRRRKRPAHLGHSVGFVFPFCQVRIVDDQGRPVGRGEPGRILVRSKGVHSGYLNRPDVPSKDYPERRWWDTGDWGRKSWFGTLSLIDRQVDKLSTSASAIAMEDDLLERFSELLELVIIEHEGSLVPVVSVRPGHTLDPATWTNATADFPQLADPLVISDESFPRTITGKVQRDQLKTSLARPET